MPMTDNPDKLAVPFLLVVDDEAALREVMQQILEYEGYHIEAAGSADEAHQILKSANIRPQLIISDLLLPGTDGYQLMRQVQADYPNQPIPFLFVSGQEATSLFEDASLTGVVGYLSKPFVVDELLATIARVVGNGEQA